MSAAHPGPFFMGRNWPNKRGAILAGSALAGGVFSDFLGRKWRTRGTRYKRPRGRGSAKAAFAAEMKRGSCFLGLFPLQLNNWRIV